MFWAICAAIIFFLLICLICCANLRDEEVNFDFVKRESKKDTPEKQKQLQATIKKFEGYVNKQSNKNNEVCAICLNYFKIGSEIAELKCTSKHIFHLRCMINWI